ADPAALLVGQPDDGRPALQGVLDGADDLVGLDAVELHRELLGGVDDADSHFQHDRAASVRVGAGEAPKPPSCPPLVRAALYSASSVGWSVPETGSSSATSEPSGCWLISGPLGPCRAGIEANSPLPLRQGVSFRITRQ